MAIDLTKHGIAAIEAGLDKATEVIQKHIDERQSEFDALAVATIKQRAKLGFGAAPILVRSGTLKDHLADVRQITTSNTTIEGVISPSTQAVPPRYGKEPISEYAAALDKKRPFYDLRDDKDKAAVIEAIKEAFIKSFNG